METPLSARVCRWIILATLFLCAGISNATGNFVSVSLPKDVTVEIPKNWSVLSNNQRITLDSWVQAKRELSGNSDQSSELSFAANYYDDQGTIAAMFNIRYYPEMKATQDESRSATAADTKTLDDALQGQVVSALNQFGMRVLKWMGTTKQSINGIVAFVTEYRRTGTREGTPFRVRLVKVANASRSFTITVSYREDQEDLLRAICDRVIQSIQTKAKAQDHTKTIQVFAQTVMVKNSPRPFTVVPPHSWVQQPTTTGNSRVKFAAPPGTPSAECAVIVKEFPGLRNMSQSMFDQQMAESPDVDKTASQLSSRVNNVRVFATGVASVSGHPAQLINFRYSIGSPAGEMWFRGITVTAGTTPGIVWTISCGGQGGTADEAQKGYSYWQLEINRFTTNVKILP